jgi:hypothetical protein
MHAIAPPAQLPGSALRRTADVPTLDELAHEVAQLRASLGQPVRHSRYAPRSRLLRICASPRALPRAVRR